MEGEKVKRRKRDCFKCIALSNFPTISSVSHLTRNIKTNRRLVLEMF